jgi:chloramphenicol-sensitive protein RarD
MSRPQPLDRTGLGAALACYLLWGSFPFLFRAMAATGASAWEIVGWRMVFSVPVAAALVLFTGRMQAFMGLFGQPRQLAMLTLSALLVATNWTVYVWAVNSGHTLPASLGYYINPLLNAAVGAVFFKEAISRSGFIALILAGIGVAVQAVTAADAPWIPIVLAVSFSSYGIVRRQVSADAQTGLLMECVVLLPIATIGLSWLARHGGVHFGSSWNVSLLLLTAGPATVVPLALFSFATRRLPFNIVGFIQFITPGMLFVSGLMMGEKLTALKLVSFGFIWAGVAVFAYGLIGQMRRVQALTDADNTV